MKNVHIERTNCHKMIEIFLSFFKVKHSLVEVAFQMGNLFTYYFIFIFLFNKILQFQFSLVQFVEVSNSFCKLPRNCLHFANSKLFEYSDKHLLVTPPRHLGKNRSGKCPTLNHYLFTLLEGLSLLTWLISFSLFLLPLIRV